MMGINIDDDVLSCFTSQIQVKKTVNHWALDSQRVPLHGSILGADSLRHLSHVLVVLQNLGVLQLVEVVCDPRERLLAPDLTR